MKKLLVVLEREYMERVRTRWFLVATIFGPVFFGLLMFLPAWVANRSEASSDVARIRILDVTNANERHRGRPAEGDQGMRRARPGHPGGKRLTLCGPERFVARRHAPDRERRVP